MKIMLPWPPRVLSPNSRVHWAKLMRAKREFKRECMAAALKQGVRPLPLQRNGLHVDLLFVPPTRRVFDLDNALAAMKSGLDGLADVLHVDDSQWAFSIAKAPLGVVGGMVYVTVKQVDI